MVVVQHEGNTMVDSGKLIDMVEKSPSVRDNFCQNFSTVVLLS